MTDRTNIVSIGGVTSERRPSLEPGPDATPLDRLPDDATSFPDINDDVDQKNPLSTVELPAATPSSKVRVPRLTNIAKVRKEMSRQYAEQLRGKIDTQTLTRRIYALVAIREAFRDDEVERRLAVIEERLTK